MNDWYAIFCVRDSVDSIAEVVTSLANQTISPKEIIVVDDGSSDGTYAVLIGLQKHFPTLTILETNSKTRDYSRIPSLWNMGLRKQYDFHMISGGDTSYEKDYAEKILAEFQQDQRLVIAGGSIGAKIHSPHGAERFVRQDFFFKYYEKYLELMGYESEILYKALINNYKIKILGNAKMFHHEKYGGRHSFVEWGESMRAMGYHPLFVLGRCFLEFFGHGITGKKGALNMLYRYLRYKPQKDGYFSEFPIETRNTIREYQKKLIIEKLAMYENFIKLLNKLRIRTLLILR